MSPIKGIMGQSPGPGGMSEYSNETVIIHDSLSPDIIDKKNKTSLTENI